MTKKELIKWLELKHQEALKNAEQQYNQAVEMHCTRLYNKIELSKISGEIEAHLHAAHDLYENWKKKHSEDVTIIERYGSGIGTSLARLVNSNGGICNVMKKYDISDNTLHMKSLRKKRRETLDGINRNYENLILNVQNIKTAVLACKYLKEIGFDTSHIETPKSICTALAVEIDPKYLFVNHA